jgi:peptidoglycan/LPS O-acetylase OafA/YrhL
MKVAGLTDGVRNQPSAKPLDLRLRQNNFDLLRFLFAFVVFLVHAYILSGAEALSVLNGILSSEIAVKSFFVVSGFLIFMSYENSHDARSYFSKRIRRIYPAYFAVVMGCAVLGAVFSTYAWNDYFSVQALKYLTANLAFLNFLQPNLPGLFENNQLQAVNGALWTLKIEVMFYLTVPLVVMALRKFGKAQVLVTLYVCSEAYSAVMGMLAVKSGAGFYLELQRQLPGQLAFFIAGAAAYYYFEYLARYSRWFVAIAIAAFVLQAWLPWAAIQPVALGILVVYVACVIPCIGNFGKYGDFSYGVYILHFPILQVLIAYGLFAESPWLSLVGAGFLVIAVAFLFWHFIEKPFLRKSSHYVAVNHG